jgi:hypothetical protein
MWLMRLGLAALKRPKVKASDWVWLVDHSIQIGPTKCLVILGIRLSDLPPDRPLCHQDLEPIALVPMTDASQQRVARCLEEAATRTGVPRAILDDHGGDLHGGVRLFRQAHPETDEFYDIKHKAACLLRAELEHNPQWQAYATQLGATKCALQQTALACLTPPSQRSKARFMNLGKLVQWGVATRALLQARSLLRRLGLPVAQVRAQLGWLRRFRGALRDWSACHVMIQKTLDLIRRQGLTTRVGPALEATLPVASGIAGRLRRRLIDFVIDESSQVRPGERIPGTTEVLESCFGKLKALEDGQSKSGFTGLVLSLGAMVSTWTAETAGRALECCGVKEVRQWCRDHLGRTIQSQRRQAYAGLKVAQ